MTPLAQIFRFAGWAALIGALVFVIPDFWQNLGSKPPAEVAAQSAMLGVGIAFLFLLVGSVIYQRLNAVFSARDALASGAVLALPVILTFIAWVAVSVRPSAEAVISGAIVFIAGWVLFSFFAFVVIYLFPRVVGVMPFGR